MRAMKDTPNQSADAAWALAWAADKGAAGEAMGGQCVSASHEGLRDRGGASVTGPTYGWQQGAYGNRDWEMV